MGTNIQQNDITNSLLSTVQLMADSSAQAKEATLVIEAEIVAVVDEGLGTYVVKYLKNKFNATAPNTEITYSINLELPGEYYDFTVDVVNKGTMDAKVSEVNNNQLTEEQQKYLSYQVTY